MYIELNSNNQVMGHSDQGSANSIQTDQIIPEFSDTQILKFVNGNIIVEDSQELIDKKAEYDTQEYARNRATAFPSIGDQLDMQYHDLLDGTTTWKDAVAKVKSDNPKE